MCKEVLKKTNFVKNFIKRCKKLQKGNVCKIIDNISLKKSIFKYVKIYLYPNK